MEGLLAVDSSPRGCDSNASNVRSAQNGRVANGAEGTGSESHVSSHWLPVLETHGSFDWRCEHQSLALRLPTLSGVASAGNLSTTEATELPLWCFHLRHKGPSTTSIEHCFLNHTATLGASRLLECRKTPRRHRFLANSLGDSVPTGRGSSCMRQVLLHKASELPLDPRKRPPEAPKGDSLAQELKSPESRGAWRSGQELVLRTPGSNGRGGKGAEVG